MQSNSPTQWDQCLAIIRDNITAEQYDAWFSPITVKSFENGRLTLTVPSPYFVEHIETHFMNLIGAAIKRVYGPQIQLFYNYNQIKNEPSTAIDLRAVKQSPAVKPGQPDANPFRTSVQSSFDSQLNPRYNFDNYCGSISNKIALSIGKAIGDDPDNKTFNPLFIFGPSGVGKTHLMHAIGLSIKEHRPDRRVLYISSRLFESQFTVASRNGKINDFINFYQSIDVLIIDDIQDLIDKEKTQNTFFHIFSHLHLNNRQIIISSDCSPSQLKGMPERLLTRMKWGMTVELERPDASLRREVLSRKAEQDGLDLPADVLDFIAENVTESIRELEGIVVSLIAHATILNREIDLDLARTVLAHSVKINKRQINFEMVTQCVSAHFDLEPDAIFSKVRKREISDARQMVMYLAKKHAKMSSTAIATRLDRTHATVLHGCKNIEQRLPYEKSLQETISAIESMILH